MKLTEQPWFQLGNVPALQKLNGELECFTYNSGLLIDKAYFQFFFEGT